MGCMKTVHVNGVGLAAVASFSYIRAAVHVDEVCSGHCLQRSKEAASSG